MGLFDKLFNNKHEELTQEVGNVNEQALDEKRDMIEGIEESVNNIPMRHWSEDDDNLLKTLLDRQCPVEIIASVFKKEVNDIEERMTILNVK